MKNLARRLSRQSPNLFSAAQAEKIKEGSNEGAICA